MKTMGGKRSDQEPADEIDFNDMVGDSVDIESYEEPQEPPEKRHKKHKHKRHKKKKPFPEDEESADVDIDDFETISAPKPSLKLKIKLPESPSDRRQKEKVALVKSIVDKTQTPSSPIVLSPTTLKLLSKKKKGIKGKDSGTSSEEERWLDAIESGKLEEVDDELKKIKDPKLMTARQRAMFEKKTDKEPSPGGEQLMALPSGYKEKVLTEEMIEKRALKLLKRKQMAEEKREKDKKITMERLLKKQDSKATKIRPIRTSKNQLPRISYRCTTDGVSISLPTGVEFPLSKQGPISSPPLNSLCAVQGCTKLKKYSCSKTGVPLCSFQCYKRNLEVSRGT